MKRPSLMRWSAFAVVGALPVFAAACSSGGSSTSTTAASGTAALGVPFSVWVQAHPATQAGGVSGYGSTVARGSGSVPQFTDVHQLNGRVVSMRLNLPSGTRLATAEAQVRAQLPSDSRQTASWRGAFPGSPLTYCEFVNYQSAALAHSLGIPPPTGQAANIGTSLYNHTGTTHTTSIARVNTADISTAANVVGKAC